jgi:hypothetical protein
MRQKIEALHPKPTAAMTALTTATTAAPLVFAAWALVSFLLALLGILSSDAARKNPSRLTCAVYRVVIWKSIAMFYVSALLFGVTLAAGVGILSVLFLRLAGATHVVEAAFGAVGAYLVFASVRAVVGRVPDEERGTRVNLKKEPKLRATLDRIAKRFHVEKIDYVLVVPDASLEVREIGSALAHARGHSTRTLVIGVAALDGLTVHGFEAVVASELLCYRGRDGAGGDVAIVERASLDALVDRMRTRGVAIAVNPAWWFVSAYSALFRWMTEGAIELQEKRADARAAKGYGSDVLAAALRHLTRKHIELEARTAASIGDLLAGERPPEDVYARDVDADLRQSIDDALAEVAERIEAITALNEAAHDEEEDAPAWSLLSDRKALERAMNARLLATLHEQFGVEDDQPSKAKAVART